MLASNAAQWFIEMPPEIAVFLLSMIPITEIRASIPIGIGVYGLPVWKTLCIGIIGNMIPPVLIISLLSSRLYPWLISHRLLGKHITKQLTRAQEKLSGNYAKYGALALIIFVGIPLPLTGTWTGSLAAVVFNIPPKKALVYIFIGACIAGIILSIMSVSAQKIVTEIG